MSISLGWMGAHCPILWAAKNTINRRIKSLPNYLHNGGFWEGAQLLSTNLMDMTEDPYKEDGVK
jgi:hypothetical protein